jgi:hypothetical protein
MTQTEATKRKRLAPYVPPSALSAFFDHIRYVKTPDRVDSNLVQDYGTVPGHAFALISALKFLGLTEDDGTTTPAFRALQTGGPEFQTALSDILKSAYADLFSRLDVSRDSRDKIKNFFARNYSPATAEKATRLFLDLCGEAGIVTTAGSQPRQVSRPTEKPTAVRVRRLAPPAPPAPPADGTGRERIVLEVRLTEDDLSMMTAEDIAAVFAAAGQIEVARRRAQADEKEVTPEAE